MSDREILTMTMAQLAATRPISFEGPTGSAYSSWARELRIRAQAIIDEAAKATAALPAAAQASVPLGGLSQEVIDHHRKLRAGCEAAWGVGVPDPMRGIDAQAKGEEGPTWNAVWDAVKDAETAWARRQFDGDDTSLEAAQNAAVRSLCLASRAPSIEDVVDALLRVTSYKSSYETGASGLVCRADVEQVMRALFDRSGK